MLGIISGQHYVEEGFVSRAKFMSDEDYSAALDSLVLACVDVVVVNRDSGKMLLGKRVQEPQADWWIIGGRMRPGESFHETISRNVKRELGLEIEPSRFQYLCIYSTVWARRAQEPKDHGSHTISITMLLEVSDEEANMIAPNEEYEYIQWVSTQRVVEDESLHPAVRMVARNTVIFLGKS